MLNYAVNPQGIASEHFQDETIILNLPKGNYYSLKGTGQFIWSQLEKNISSDLIVELLSNYYAVTNDVAEPTLEVFLNQLFQEELIKEIEPSGVNTSPEIISNTAAESFATPVLEVYTDMQELLMLDPIHDADPEKGGWPYKNNG
jgi:hypothetical protein